ncbi:MAG: hypothetical protein ACK5TR_06760 [Alphaproteobacteria bacterium]|jgi:tetratricopeptide (TPR) repeat protein
MFKLRYVIFLLFGMSISAFSKESMPLIWNISTNVGTFLGRSSYLDDIKTKILKGPLVITGPSGIGKTSLVGEYARRNHKKYQVVWLFNLSKGMDEQMTELARKLHAYKGHKTPLVFKKGEDALSYVKTTLRLATFSSLLIFDNAPNLLAATEYIPETHGKKNNHTLVTSLSGRNSDNVMTLTHFTPQEADRFLTHYFPSASKDDLKLLATTLENHPLAMYQAALYIKSTPGMDIPSYVDYFTKHKDEYWRSERIALGTQPLLYTAIKMSIDRLQKERPEDYTLLVGLSLLDTSHLDHTLIQKAYTSLNNGDMGGFGEILDTALISQGEGQVYKIHDYVRDVIIASAPQETLKKAAAMDAKVFLALFPDNIEDCVDVFEKTPGLVGHLKKLVDHMDVSPTNDLFGVALRLFYYTDVIARDYAFAHPFSTKLKNFIDVNLTLDPYLAGVFYSWYGDAKIVPAGVDAAIAEFKRADAFFKKANSEQARYGRVMLLANNLGFFLHYKGDIAAAEACLKEAKRLQEGHEALLPQTAIYELEAVLAQDKGEYARAIDILNHELSLIKDDAVLMRSLGHFAKSLKASALLKLASQRAHEKKQDEATTLYREAHMVSVDARKHAVESLDGKEDEEVVARTLLYLSQSESALGEFHKAEATAKKAIKILDAFYGSPHRRQAVAHMALGDAYMGQKRYKEGLGEYRAAESLYEKIASHRSFDDLSELYLKIVKAAIHLNDRERVHIYQAKHKQTFSTDHPRYFEMIKESKKANLL